MSELVSYLTQFGPLFTIIFGILSFITAIVIAYVNNRRLHKSLSYWIKTNTAIFSLEKGIRDKFQILYEGKEIENARLFIISVSNNGQQSIKKEDFDGDLEFVFSSDGNILFAEINHRHPDNLKIAVQQKANSLLIKPALLNPGDSFEIKGIVTSNNDRIACDARIEGITEVKKINPFMPAIKISFLNVFITILVIFIALLLLIGGNVENKSLGLALIALVIGYWFSQDKSKFI